MSAKIQQLKSAIEPTLGGKVAGLKEALDLLARAAGA